MPMNGFLVRHRSFPTEELLIPFEPESDTVLLAQVWDDEVEAVAVSEKADRLLSKWLNREVKLVMMPDWASRPVDPNYTQNGENVSFADGYPVLLIGQASLDDLNARLQVPVSMIRFRPNLVVRGADAYAEDSWKDITIGSTNFKGVKPCGRCVLTTIDPSTGQAGTEPLKTLATYRKQNNKVLFGMNLLAQPGRISAGESVVIN